MIGSMLQRSGAWHRRVETNEAYWKSLKFSDVLKMFCGGGGWACGGQGREDAVIKNCLALTSFLVSLLPGALLS